MCESNSAQVQTLAARLQESELEHQQLHTAQERQLQLEAQALRRSQDLEEQQASSIAHEYADKQKHNQTCSSRNGSLKRLSKLRTMMLLRQQGKQWCRIFSPEVFLDSCLLEESTIEVESKDAVEQVHALVLGEVLRKVAA